MPRFDSLQEFEEWRRGQGPSARPDVPITPSPPANGNAKPTPSARARPSAMSIRLPPMPRALFNPRVRRLIPAFLWLTAAAIAAFIVWSLFWPAIPDAVTWIGNNVNLLSLGIAILAIVSAGYVVVLHHHVYELLPQDVLTLRADVMRRLDRIESRKHSESSTPISGAATVSSERTSTMQKEFEQWMQSEQSTP